MADLKSSCELSSGHEGPKAPSSGHFASQRRPRWLIALHWLTVLLLVMAALTVLFRDIADEKSLRQQLLNIHRQLGLLVFVAAFARILMRACLGRLPPLHEGGPWASVIAAVTHFALYACILTLPLLGWAASNAAGHSVSLLGAPLPEIAGEEMALADELADRHRLAAWLLLGLSGLHMVAALWHHFVRGDGVLRAMLPGTGAHRAVTTPIGSSTGVERNGSSHANQAESARISALAATDQAAADAVGIRAKGGA